VLVPDPKLITTEFQSAAARARVIVLLSLHLSPLRLEVRILADGIFSRRCTVRHWDPACLRLVQLVSLMESALVYPFFEVILQRTTCDMAVSAGHVFLVNVRIESFGRIYRNADELIGKGSATLHNFLRMVMPSYVRLKGCEETATQMLCGCFESVTEEALRELQETLVDAPCFVCARLPLAAPRARLVAAVEWLAPDLGAPAAASLACDSPGDQAVQESWLIEIAAEFDLGPVAGGLTRTLRTCGERD